MKVLFLDIDGVLNCRARWAECVTVPHRHGGARLDPEAVKRLERVVRATGCRIVISSTWRLAYPLEEIAGRLYGLGLSPGTVVDRTPRFGLPVDRLLEPAEALTAAKRFEETRGAQVDAWLKARRGQVKVFAIVDDDRDLDPYMDRLVKTTWDDGLLDEHVDLLIEKLGATDGSGHRRRQARPRAAAHTKRQSNP